MKKVSWLLFVCWLSAGPFSPGELRAGERDNASVAQKSRYFELARELAEQLNNNVQFYGKVTDFDSVPVPNAVVKASVRVAGAATSDQEFKRFEVMTDNQGCFALNTYGDVFSVDEIVLAGYKYHFRYNRVRDFKSVKKDKQQGPGYEPDQPATFRIRKLGPPAFVVVRNMTFGLKPGKPAMLDLLKMEWVYDEPTLIAMQYSSIDRDWHMDFKLSVEGESGKLRLILEAPDPDSGFVVEKHEFFEMMTEAPEHGYRQQLEFHVKPGESPITAYVKCQGGLFYSKVNLDYRENHPGVVSINATYFTNLSKERGLEYIPGIESQYDREVYSEHTRDLVNRADLLSGKPIEVPKPREK